MNQPLTNRERVLKAINFEKTDYIPYTVSFTSQSYEKVAAAMGEDYINHIDDYSY